MLGSDGNMFKPVLPGFRLATPLFMHRSYPSIEIYETDLLPVNTGYEF